MGQHWATICWILPATDGPPVGHLWIVLTVTESPRMLVAGSCAVNIICHLKLDHSWINSRQSWSATRGLPLDQWWQSIGLPPVGHQWADEGAPLVATILGPLKLPLLFHKWAAIDMRTGIFMLLLPLYDLPCHPKCKKLSPLSIVLYPKIGFCLYHGLTVFFLILRCG
jgi:hypothetical protein